jgi:tRNA-dihydrouridine synthase C
MRRVYPAAQQAFDELRLVHDAQKIDVWLAQRQPKPSAHPMKTA